MSQTLQTALGVVFVFALSALFCSAIVETLANILQRRAVYLVTGLRNMLDEPEGEKEKSKDDSAAEGKVARVQASDIKAPTTKGETRKLHAQLKEPVIPSALLLGREYELGARAAVLAARAKELRTAAVQTSATPEHVAALAEAAAQAAQTEASNVTAQGAPAAPDSIAVPSSAMLTATFYDHPMIRSLQTRRVAILREGKLRNPQYIPAATFARVLVATLLPDGARDGDPHLVRDLRAAVAKLPERFAARKSLLTLLDQAGHDASVLQKSIEDWYDAQMGRISGWYKRWTQLVLLFVGLIFAVVLNVDAIQVTHTLWVDEPLRTAVVAQVADGTICADKTGQDAKDCADAALGDLKADGVPLGHRLGCPAHLDTCFESDVTDDAGVNTFLKIVGWLVTAIAVTFGAPFWFDTVSKLGNLRVGGTRPAPAT